MHNFNSEPFRNKRNFKANDGADNKKFSFTQNNPSESESFVPDFYEVFGKKPYNASKNGKTYGCVKIKATSKEEEKPNTTHDRFLHIIMLAALITAIVCMCLSVASMFMYFLI